MAISDKPKQRKRPASPLSALAGMNFEEFEETSNKNAEQNSLEKRIILVEPEKIKNWSFHDRPESELGDIENLAKELKDPEIGQQQPCIVRPCSDSGYTYEVIAGERRWRAALLAKVKLAIVVQPLTDSQAAYCQIAENHNREDLSDYSIGMSFATLLKHEFLKQKDLQSKFDLSPVQINRYLSFSQLPQDFISACGDISKISARTAAEIRSLLKKGNEYKEAILILAPRISDGKIGEKTLKRELEKLLSKKERKPKISARKFFDQDNKTLFTAKKTNGSVSLKFPNNVAKMIDTDELLEFIKEKICKSMR